MVRGDPLGDPSLHVGGSFSLMLTFRIGRAAL
jgi:hypothetical protein